MRGNTKAILIVAVQAEADKDFAAAQSIARAAVAGELADVTYGATPLPRDLRVAVMGRREGPYGHHISGTSSTTWA